MVTTHAALREHLPVREAWPPVAHCVRHDEREREEEEAEDEVPAIAIQMMRPMMPKPNHTISLLALVSLFSSDTTRTAKPSHHADWVNPPTFPRPDVVRT